MTIPEFEVHLLLLGFALERDRIVQQSMHVTTLQARRDPTAHSNPSFAGWITYRPRGECGLSGFARWGTRSKPIRFRGKRKQVLKGIINLLEERVHGMA